MLTSREERNRPPEAKCYVQTDFVCVRRIFLIVLSLNLDLFGLDYSKTHTHTSESLLPKIIS